MRRRRQPGPAAAAALPGSAVDLTGVGLNARRLGFVNALRALGADITIDETHRPAGSRSAAFMSSTVIMVTPTLGPAEVPDLIDELPGARRACGARRIPGSQRRLGAAGERKRPHRTTRGRIPDARC
jgi:hypothetical protein